MIMMPEIMVNVVNSIMIVVLLLKNHVLLMYDGNEFDAGIELLLITDLLLILFVIIMILLEVDGVQIVLGTCQ